MEVDPLVMTVTVRELEAMAIEIMSFPFFKMLDFSHTYVNVYRSVSRVFFSKRLELNKKTKQIPSFFKIIITRTSSKVES